MDEFGPHRESCQLQQLRNDQIWQNAANAANGNYNLDFLQSNVRKWTTAMARQRDKQHACSEECTRDGNAEVATMQSFGREKTIAQLRQREKDKRNTNGIYS